MMSHGQQPSWVRHMLLASALGAGALATLLVPPYREVAFAPEDDGPASHAASPDSTHRGVTGVDADVHHRNVVRSTI
jgi:hypothetical protein